MEEKSSRKKYTVGEEANPKIFISWGMGVQSTTLGVLSVLGKIPKPDAIISADTQWERRITYEVAKWYTEFFNKNNIPVYIVTAGNIFLDKDRTHSDLPLWYGKSGAPLRRQCTAFYKIEPIRRKIRELMGLRLDNKGRTKKNSALMYLGISTDEAIRMADSNRAWIKNVYPLIDLGMSRQDCIDLLKELKFPIPPKSSCIGCPFTDAKRWLELKNTSPDEWKQAVQFDKQIRRPPQRMLERGFTEDLYLWKGKKPLDEENFEEYINQKSPLDLCDSGYCFV